MLQRDIRQLRRPAAEGIQRHVDAGKQKAALIVAPFGDDADGGGGAHVDGDNGCRILFQGRDRICHDVGSHLGVDLHPNVQPCLDARPHHHGRLAQKPGQCLFHHKIQRWNHTAQDCPTNRTIVKMIERKEVHKINANLISSFAAVCIHRS